MRNHPYKNQRRRRIWSYRTTCILDSRKPKWPGYSCVDFKLFDPTSIQCLCTVYAHAHTMLEVEWRTHRLRRFLSKYCSVVRTPRNLEIFRAWSLDKSKSKPRVSHLLQLLSKPCLEMGARSPASSSISGCVPAKVTLGDLEHPLQDGTRNKQATYCIPGAGFKVDDPKVPKGSVTIFARCLRSRFWSALQR